VKTLGTPARAIAILAGAGLAAFAISTVAVSAATTNVSVPSATFRYPFAKFSVLGSVTTSRPSRPSTFSLNFTTTFTLAAGSPGLIDKATATLFNIAIVETVSYPIPAGKAATTFVGPAALPFSSEKLALSVAIKGSCFIATPTGSYVFRGNTKCATATLKLGIKSYKASSLLKSINGSFTPDPTGAPDWTGKLTATFSSPGYTFPVATLGSGGGTTLAIGPNGGKKATRSIAFGG
jgi:hypothetical protein